VIPVVCLTVVAVALLAALIYRELAHDRERVQLLDRIQVPEATHAAAFARALPPAPAIPNTDAEDDARFGRDLDDLEFLDPEPV
jgi:hypothetical protein